MKKVGIIGGAGPLASALLYETIIRESYRQGLQVPEIQLINFPFTRGLTVEEGHTNENVLLEELRYCMKKLEQSGVEIGVLACNTLHLYLPLLPKSAIFFLSLPNLIVGEAIEKGDLCLLMLGTENSCRSHLYQRPSITLRYPPKNEQTLVDAIIDRVLEGNLSQQDSLLISQLIERLSEQMTFDGVILGCTDLPVLHHYFPITSAKPFYDSIKIPAKILRRIL